MKPIKLTQSSLQKAKESLLAQLDGLKLQDTKINLTYDLAEILKEQLANNTIKRPIVYMMANTYLKMLEYVLKCDTEIAWHGTVTRGKGEKSHIFCIKDVYLYPQKIAAATVQVDDDKYTQWSDKQDAETFNNRRFQGHSHVNMATFYSGTDQTNKNAFLQDLLDDDYYIFLVTNKRQEHNFEIYDLTQNIIFENKDIDFRVYLDNDTLLERALEDIEKFCTKETYSSNPYRGYETLDPFRGIQASSYGKMITKDPIQPSKTPPSKAQNIKVKRHVVLMNRVGRDFESEHKEFEGERTNIRFNGQNYEVFIPYLPFSAFDITILRQAGWHIREMPVPEHLN